MVIAADNIRIERFSFASFGNDAAPAAIPNTSTPAEQETTPETAPVPPAPVFSEAQLEAARAEGYKKGAEEERLQMQTAKMKEDLAREEALHKLLQVIANRITLAAEDHTKQLEKQRADIYPLALAIAKKIAGVALHQDAYAPLEALLHNCSALVITEPVVTIVVAPHFAESLSSRLDALRDFLIGFEGKIEVKSDLALHEQDCRVEWQRGFMEHNTLRLWADIEKLLIPTTTVAEG